MSDPLIMNRTERNEPPKPNAFAQIWVAVRTVASRLIDMEEKLASLSTPDPGVDGKDGVGLSSALVGAEGNLVLALTDGRTIDLGRIVGRDGKDGKDADPGVDGKDGVGLSTALLGTEGNLVLALTDGRTIDLGRIVGRDGKDGKDADPGKAGASIDSAEVTDDGRLMLRRSDGVDIDAGVVTRKGDPGESVTGPAGRGIAAIAIEDRRMVITMTDGEMIKLGPVVGKDGKNGRDADPAEAVAAISVTDMRPANLAPDDFSRLMETVLSLPDGSQIRVITLS